MKATALIVGIILALLGALWLLQGLGIVTMKPILCFAECTAIEGPAPTWAILGALALLFGMVSIRFGVKGRRRS